MVNPDTPMRSDDPNKDSTLYEVCLSRHEEIISVLSIQT